MCRFKSVIAIVVTFLVILSGGCSSTPKRPDEVLEITDYLCTPAREFITTMNYLRERPNFGLKDQKAQEVAMSVAGGCRGAAQRFIQTTEMLLQAGIVGREAVETGIVMSRGEDDQGEAFQRVFRTAFLPRGLDMKPEDALGLAKSLSIDLKGDRKKALQDFERLVDFCVDSSTLDLPRPKCGAIAGKVAVKGANSDEGVATPYIKTVEFLTRSSDGPQLVLFQAFTIAEELAINSPKALDNFLQGYKWLTSKSGLSLDRKDAVDMAKKIALKTAQKRLVRFSSH